MPMRHRRNLLHSRTCRGFRGRSPIRQRHHPHTLDLRCQLGDLLREQKPGRKSVRAHYRRNRAYGGRSHLHGVSNHRIEMAGPRSSRNRRTWHRRNLHTRFRRMQEHPRCPTQVPACRFGHQGHPNHCPYHREPPSAPARAAGTHRSAAWKWSIRATVVEAGPPRSPLQSRVPLLVVSFPPATLGPPAYQQSDCLRAWQ